MYGYFGKLAFESRLGGQHFITCIKFSLITFAYKTSKQNRQIYIKSSKIWGATF